MLCFACCLLLVLLCIAPSMLPGGASPVPSGGCIDNVLATACLSAAPLCMCQFQAAYKDFCIMWKVSLLCNCVRLDPTKMQIPKKQQQKGLCRGLNIADVLYAAGRTCMQPVCLTWKVVNKTPVCPKQRETIMAYAA